MPSLPSANITLAMAVKNYEEADINIFWSCPTLLDFLTLRHFFQDCLRKQVFPYKRPQSPWNFNTLIFLTLQNLSKFLVQNKMGKLQNSSKFNSFLWTLFGMFGSKSDIWKPLVSMWGVFIDTTFLSKNRIVSEIWIITKDAEVKRKTFWQWQT